MKKIALMSLLFIFVSNLAFAETCLNEQPWYVYGQTKTIPNGSVDNPIANANGLRGETSLPYLVPNNREVRINSYGLEAYNVITTNNNAPQGVVAFPYIGQSPPPSNNSGLHSVYSSLRSTETVGVNFIIPANKIINWRIQSSYTLPWVVGWYINGKICDVP